jgi:hypothetical protein
VTDEIIKSRTAETHITCLFHELNEKTLILKKRIKRLQNFRLQLGQIVYYFNSASYNIYKTEGGKSNGCKI